MNPAFTPDEWVDILESDLDYWERGVVSIIPFSGLTTNALAHLRSDWIDWRQDRVEITIPSQASCNSFQTKGNSIISNQPPPIERRKRPCERCRNEGDTDQFQNRWDTGYNVEIKRYWTALNRDIAEPAVEFLNTIFNVYGRSEVATSQPTLIEAADSAAGDLVEPDSAATTKLRRTGPVIYAEYGLTHSEISEITPYTKKTIELILDTTPEVNSESTDTRQLLKQVKNQEPVTAKELGEELDQDPTGIRKRLNHLKSKDRVNVNNHHFGPPAAEWTTTDIWDAPFECEHCNFESWSVMGIQTHKDLKHK